MSAKAVKSGLIILFGIGISALAVYFLATTVDWPVLVQQLKSANPYWLLPMLLISPLAIYLRVIRWRLFLPATPRPSSLVLFDSASIGFFLSFLLPLRAGEIARVAALSRWSGLPLATTATSLLVERVFDLIVILALLVLAIDQSIPSQLVPVFTGLSWLTGLALIGIIASAVFSSQMETLVSFIFKYLPGPAAVKDKLLKFALQVLQGLVIVGKPKALLLSLFWTTILWLVITAQILFVGLCFSQIFSLREILVTNSVIALAVAFPSAPGFIGTYHAGCYLALTTLYKYPEALSIAVALVLHAVQLILMVIIGLDVIRRRGREALSLSAKSAIPDRN